MSCPVAGCDAHGVDTITVTMSTTESLTDAQRAAVVDLCVAAHDEEEFTKLFTTYIPSGGRHFLGHLGDELVSHAVVTTRWVQSADHPVFTTAFVDAVSTRPEHQSRGYGSAVMRGLAAEIGDYEIGCLVTDRPGFYSRLGWELWRGPLAGRGEDGLMPTPDQGGVMVLRLLRTPPLDLETQLTIEPQPTRIWE
jgi:aminoglycoside 2'-N-acetyltransferase I